MKASISFDCGSSAVFAVLLVKVKAGDLFVNVPGETAGFIRSLNRRTDALERRLYSFHANKLRSLPAAQDSPLG